MQHAKLKILCLAMSVCAVATASAQTYGPAMGDTVDDGKAISDSKGSAGRDLPRSVPAMGDTTDIGPEVSAPNPNVNLGPIPQKIPRGSPFTVVRVAISPCARRTAATVSPS